MAAHIGRALELGIHGCTHRSGSRLMGNFSTVGDNGWTQVYVGGVELVWFSWGN